ncbi:MAG: 50S ribosomal protein L29 [Candidatus Kaiserbacteria bacterium]|nr:MAG: 50S ribosomal protein L29 [Candidatus Kaiserbacteria bacterium]
MTDYKDKNREDLLKVVSQKREALRLFRFGGAGSRTRNTREGRTLRKEIAQILTELRSREIASVAKTK